MNPGEFVLALIRSTFPSVEHAAQLTDWQQTAVPQLIARLGTYGGAVLADEVGSGKSFIAAAVAAELNRRGSSVEFIVPASLVHQWRELLRGWPLEARVRSHDSLLRDECAVDGGNRLIVVDEAHRFRNPATKRYRALALRSIGTMILLVTATPICNQLADLLWIIRLFAADDLLGAEGVYSLERAFKVEDRQEVEIIVQELVIRRTLAMISTLRLPSLRRAVIRYPLSPRAGAIAELLDALEFPIIAAAGERTLLRQLLWRRLESSITALLDSIRRQRRFYRRALEASTDGCLLTRKGYRLLFGDDGDDVPFQELMFRNFWMPSDSVDTEPIHLELRTLDRLVNCLTEDLVTCTKVERLRALLLDETPTLIFTFAVATAREVQRQLQNDRPTGLVTSSECRVGGDRASGPEEVFQAFAAGRIDTVVTTDLASEGLNLQRAARVVHYDLPWNPVRLDQRTGRARRLGQTREEVVAVYFLPVRSDDANSVVQKISAKRRMRRLFLEPSNEGYDPYLFQKWSDVALLRPSTSPTLHWASSESTAAGFLAVGICSTGEGVEDRQQLRLLALQGDSVCFSWRAIDRQLGELDGSGVSPLEGLPADMECLIARIEAVINSRLSAPCFVGEASPQTKWLRRLDESLLSNDRWRKLLSRRYRMGIEMMLRDSLQDPSPQTLFDIESMLGAEMPRRRIRILPLGGLVSRPACGCRSSACQTE